MIEFKPIVKKPGEVIRAEDWNRIQEDILSELARLEDSMQKMSGYVKSLTEGTILTGLKSTRGRSYALDEDIMGEKGNYQVALLGLITRQYLAHRHAGGDICRFGVTTQFDYLMYWAGAEPGNREIIDVDFEYSDGSTALIEGIYIHSRSALQERGTQNPFREFLLAPNQWVWYKYQLKNPHPDMEVRYVTFRNNVPEEAPRIGNVLHLRSRLRKE